MDEVALDADCIIVHNYSFSAYVILRHAGIVDSS